MIKFVKILTLLLWTLMYTEALITLFGLDNGLSFKLYSSTLYTAGYLILIRFTIKTSV